MTAEKIRAKCRIGIISSGQYPDIIGSIEHAHSILTGQLEPAGLRPIGRPVIEAAGQREMTLSWELTDEPKADAS